MSSETYQYSKQFSMCQPVFASLDASVLRFLHAAMAVGVSIFTHGVAPAIDPGTPDWLLASYLPR